MQACLSLCFVIAKRGKLPSCPSGHLLMIECYAGGGSNRFDFDTATQINLKNLLRRKSKEQNEVHHRESFS